MTRIGCAVLAAFASMLAAPASRAEVAPFVVDPAVDAKCEIVVADDAIPAEKTAARLLLKHLPKMLPEVAFALVSEGEAKAGRRIYVGATKALAAAGLDVSGWDAEDELVASRSAGLFVAGGRPRGARYAAADFLESLGVVVAAEDAQYDPRLGKIEWDRSDLRRRPAFRVRYMSLSDDFRRHDLDEFNKYNGYCGGGVDWGGYARFGKGGHCHSFRYYSKMLPRNVPEMFAMVNGKRQVPAKDGASAPLCPSSEKTRDVLISLLEEEVRAEKAKESIGLPRPRYYEVSMDDELTKCECPECRRIELEEGCFSGVMLRLVNSIARRLAEIDAEAKVTMIVYQNTLEYPKVTKPEPNVQPRVCVHDTEWLVNVKAEAIEPITSAHNEAFRETFLKWALAAKSFGVWEYWEYYTKGVFPYIAPKTYVENLRYYKALGAENMYPCFGNERHSFFMFKNWIGRKLMDKPEADYEALAGKFFAVYYGAAARPMRQYLDFLASAVEGECAKHPMGPMRMLDYEYLNFDFFRRTYSLLSEAEVAASGDPRSLRHVQAEYIAPDLVLLNRAKTPIVERLGLGRADVIARLGRIVPQHLDDMFGLGSAVGEQKWKSMKNFLESETVDAPIPAEVKGDSVFDYKYNSFYIGANTRLVEDEEAVGGKAVEFWRGEKFDSIPWCAGKKFHGLPLVIGSRTAGVQGSQRVDLKLDEAPQDEKYHLYHIGRLPIVNGSQIWMHYTGWFQFNPLDAYAETPDYKSDVWISLKLTGPSYVKGSSNPDGIFIDRLIIAR